MPEMDGYKFVNHSNQTLKPQISPSSFSPLEPKKNDQKHGFMIGATIISRNPSTQISHAHASNPDSSSSLIKNNSLRDRKPQNQSPRFDRDLM
ncbi:hypothetical protein [Rubritalea tangerina]|uniref:hypothetical protein n=1 Tax=Rubritalea tangerina TaxID=430798 RepID=UPI0036219E23